MKPVLACILLFACSGAAVAAEPIDLRRIAPIAGDATAGKAQATVCAACHGADGIAPVPLFPNLAGQHAEYLYWRLVAFRRAPPGSPMGPLVATLDDAAMRDLAAHFAAMPAPQAAGAATDASTRGAALFRDGDPANGVPPCQGCHGANAQGHPDAAHDARWRVYPALRGQHSAYIEQRLKDLAADAAPATTATHVMAPIARSLDPGAIAAVAAWLESGTP